MDSVCDIKSHTVPFGPGGVSLLAGSHVVNERPSHELSFAAHKHEQRSYRRDEPVWQP